MAASFWLGCGKRLSFESSCRQEDAQHGPGSLHLSRCAGPGLKAQRGSCPMCPTSLAAFVLQRQGLQPDLQLLPRHALPSLAASEPSPRRKRLGVLARVLGTRRSALVLRNRIGQVKEHLRNPDEGRDGMTAWDSENPLIFYQDADMQ